MSVVISAAVFIAAMIACMIAGVDTFFALVLGIVLFSVIGLKRGHKLSALWRMMWSEGRKLIPLLAIFVFIGAITALWRSSGTITFFIYYGIQIIRPGIFILVAFLLTCLLSYALGTSFGVTGTVGIILMALARSGGVDTAITAGAVLSGAYFGDRCSPASSSGLPSSKRKLQLPSSESDSAAMPHATLIPTNNNKACDFIFMQTSIKDFCAIIPQNTMRESHNPLQRYERT